MISVTWKKPSMTAGSTNDLIPLRVRKPVVHQPIRTTSPRPKEGSQLSATENTSIRRMPVTNVGTEMPISGEHARHVVATLLAAETSSRERREVAIA